jgi:Virulence-associated protein E/Bifunctional DNA primase/polymerase, N-terminal
MTGAGPRSSSPLLEAALAYAAAGLHVFPCWELTPDGRECACPRAHPSRDARGGHCGSPGKHPRTPNGCKDATTDPAIIRKWWEAWPRAHVAIAAGASGLLVVDVDPRNGGDDSLAELEREHGGLPATPRQLTEGDGVHIVFRRPDRPHVRGPRHGLGRGVDVKADGGYIIAAPSGHLSGRPYVWEIGHGLDELPIAAVPAWLLERLDARPVASTTPTSATVLEGLLGAALDAAGWLGRPLGPDKSACRCPQEDAHTTGSRWNGSTIVYAPRRPGGMGWFHCSHGHCGELTGEAVLEALPPNTIARAREALAAKGIRVAEAPPDTGAPPPGDADAPSARPVRPIGKRLRVGASDLAGVLATDPAWAGCLELDTFADRVTWARPVPVVPGLPRPAVGDELADTDMTYVAGWAATVRGWTVGLDATHAACLLAAKANKTHPVRRYLEGLVWDGTPRLATWLQTYLHAPDAPTTAAIGVWALVAAVARIFEPGCKADHVLILEGPQAAGKSEAIRVLGGPWYHPQLPNLLGERPGQELQGRWLVEIGELDAFRGIAVSRIKDFVTRPVDIYRPSYGRCSVTRPRQCVFLGTTNEDTYLRDPTGGRRFWPVATGEIRLEALRADRNHLWAEAVATYRDGVQWWPDRAWWPQLAAIQDARYEGDPWESLVSAYVTPLASVSTREILEAVVRKEAEHWTRADQMRVAEILKRLGWQLRLVGPERVRRWFPAS